MLSRLLVAAVALLLAGCAEVATPAAPSQAPPTPVVPALLPLNPAFQDCTIGITMVTFPRGTGPGTVPPAWGPSPGVGSDVRVELLDCKKVAWGPFERGPVQLMLEFHNKGDLPANCTFQRPDFIYNLERILVSDPDLANYIRSAYGIVADTGIIQVNASRPDDNFTFYSWSWGVPGQPRSTLTLGNSDTVLPTTDRVVERWIWINGTGLGILDVSRSYVAGVELGAVPGEMHPPMLYAQAVPQGAYVGLGDSGTSYQATSKLYTFRDQLCEQPVSS